MSSHPLLRFTPSALPPADLEAILVKREPLAAETVELVRGFANGDGPPMRLFVGPRGMGKTHLVAVIANRLTADTSLDGRMQVAWLDEDPYRIRNYATFLAEIQRSLTSERVPPAGLIEGPLEQWLTRRVADAPVVIVVENLDAVFERIGNDGQHRLRGLIENTRRIGFIATATSRFDDLADAQLPFYGMFEVTELDPFTLEEATELVRRIATRSDDQQLLDFLKRPQSRQRLKVVQHLTGGHPRIWLLLASSLSIDALDEVIPIFMDSLDQLTPYYQSRIQEISPDQQAIVMALVDAEGAAAVKDIAALVQVDERAAASQLGQLVRKGYVRVAAEPSVASSGDARRSYYELREPLMRLNLKVKEARGAPLEVVVAFLRAWFGAQLLDRPEAHGIGAPLGIQYVQHAIGPELLTDPTFMTGTVDELRARALYAAQLYPDRVEPVLALARSEHQTDNPEAAIARLDQRLANNPTPADRSRLLAERGNALESDCRWNEALECYSDATLSDSSNAQAHAWMGRCLFILGRYEEGLTALDTAIELEPNDAGAHATRGATLANLGRDDEALAALDTAVELDPTDARTHTTSGITRRDLGRFDEALSALDAAIELDHNHAWPHTIRGITLRGLRRHDEALAALDTAIALDPTIAGAHATRGLTLINIGRHNEALSALDTAITLDPTEAKTHAIRGFTLHSLGRHDEALTALDTSIELDATDAWAHATRGFTLIDLRRHNEALAALDTAVELAPTDAGAHTNRGIALRGLGRYDEALAALNTAIELDPTIDGAHTHRGYLRSKGGDQLRALDDLNRAVELDATDRFASGWRDVVLARLGRYDEAIQGRDTVARERPDDGDIDAIAVYLLARRPSQTASCLSRSIAAWGEQSPELAAETEWLVGDLAVDLLRGRLIDDLVAAYSSAGSLDQLGNAIVSSLGTLLPRLSSDELTDWERQWRVASSNHPALDVPLVLMNAGVAWWGDRDRAHLLALPQELRSVLEDVLMKATARAPLPQGRAKAQLARSSKR